MQLTDVPRIPERQGRLTDLEPSKYNWQLIKAYGLHRGYEELKPPTKEDDSRLRVTSINGEIQGSVTLAHAR